VNDRKAWRVGTSTIISFVLVAAVHGRGREQAGDRHMSGEMEAAGAAVTAGLVAGAIERGGAAAGTFTAHAPIAVRSCMASSVPLDQPRAPASHARPHGRGVPARHPAFRHTRLAHHAAAGLSPGTLTREYIHGKRARYISPLAMFLLLIFTMFAVFAFAGGSNVGVGKAVDIDLGPSAPVTDAATGEAAHLSG